MDIHMDPFTGIHCIQFFSEPAEAEAATTQNIFAHSQNKLANSRSGPATLRKLHAKRSRDAPIHERHERCDNMNDMNAMWNMNDMI